MQTKNKKFDIIIGIPTYNEADSISNTVVKIDKGLSRYFPEYNVLIVDMDSKSSDRTGQLFLSTKTKTEKLFLPINRQPRGKGANIFALLKLSKKLGAKYIATIDADITTITIRWPKLLLDPIVRNKAGFVAPIYTRNRYEGNTTNHFCLPLLYTWFGQWIHQPIGGDFAFNDRFVEYILEQQKPKNAFLYGIDIFMSAHALGGHFKVKEIYLGRKIHKPSFGKIVPMFQQVAATMFFVLSKYKNELTTSKTNIDRGNRQRADSFIRRPEFIKIETLKKYSLQNLRKLSAKDVEKYLGLNRETFKKIQDSKTTVCKDEWVQILANALAYIVKHKINDTATVKIATTISPFFFLRVLSYFKKLERLKDEREIDALISDQVKELKLAVNFRTIDLNKEKRYPSQQYRSFKLNIKEEKDQ